MSSVPSPAVEAPFAPPVLTLHERRVLGVLVEKAKTTPDVYPLSINALMTGCNQKSNRDPVMDMSEGDVEDALLSGQKKSLTIRITGGRVERWRHDLYTVWRVDKVELAVLAELLVRGPQTEGELRGRANRMEPINDLDALRTVLKPLVERKLVVYLTPEGRRGTVLTHGFHEAHELERLKAKVAATDWDNEPRPAAEGKPRVSVEAPSDLALQVNALKTRLADLEATVAELAGQMRHLREK